MRHVAMWQCFGGTVDSSAAPAWSSASFFARHPRANGAHPPPSLTVCFIYERAALGTIPSPSSQQPAPLETIHRDRACAISLLFCEHIKDVTTPALPPLAVDVSLLTSHNHN